MIYARFLFSLLFVCSTCLASGQARIIEHGSVSTLMEKYRVQNQESLHLQGWRIQIVTTDDRRKMEKERAKFQRLYPDIDTDWEHKAPFYVVKVGAFRDKRDFQGFLLEVKRDFPSAIPVIEKIRKAELVRS